MYKFVVVSVDDNNARHRGPRCFAIRLPVRNVLQLYRIEQYVTLTVSNIWQCSVRETNFSPEGDNYEFLYDLWAEHSKYRD